MARSAAPVVRERGRGARPLSFFLACAVVCLLQGCGTADTTEPYSPDQMKVKIDRGFTGDVGAAPTLGHTVPLEGEIISTPPCVGEAREGKECVK